MGLSTGIAVQKAPSSLNQTKKTKINSTHVMTIRFFLYFSSERLKYQKKCILPSNPAFSNSIISDLKPFPWNCSSVIHYRIFQTSAISNYFSLLQRFRNSGLQLYLKQRRDGIDLIPYYSYSQHQSARLMALKLGTRQGKSLTVHHYASCGEQGFQ